MYDIIRGKQQESATICFVARLSGGATANRTLVLSDGAAAGTRFRTNAPTKRTRLYWTLLLLALSACYGPTNDAIC
jgi:hypothetical protein